MYESLIVGTPGPTCYRAAEVFILSIAGIPRDDAVQERIRVLAEQDQQLCRRLEEDTFFRDQFWYRMFHFRIFVPTTAEEKAARITIEKAISDRIELVTAQKMQLKRFFHLLSSAEKETLPNHADTEIGFMPQWVLRNMSNFDDLRDECFDAIALECSDEDALDSPQEPNPQSGI